jgi:CBS domain-containing protein
MKVRDGMTRVVLSVGPAHTLREAARKMSAQRVGAAVVVDSDRSGIGILTERDVLDSVGAGQDPDVEVVADHRTSDVVFASPEWTLDEAAVAMASGGFRHLVVVDAGEVTGLLSMRDIVRCWSGATSGATAST